MKKEKRQGKQHNGRLWTGTIASVIAVAVAAGGILQQMKAVPVAAKESFQGIGQIVKSHDDEDPFTILDIVPGKATYTDSNSVVHDISLGTIGYLVEGQAPIEQGLANIFKNNDSYYSYTNRKAVAEQLIPTGYEDSFLHMAYQEAYEGTGKKLTESDGWIKIFDQIPADQIVDDKVPTGRFKASVKHWNDSLGTDKTGFDYEYVSGGDPALISASASTQSGYALQDEVVYKADENGEYRVIFHNPQENMSGYRVSILSTDWTNYPDATGVYELVDEEFRYAGTVKEMKIKEFGEEEEPDDMEETEPEDDNEDSEGETGDETGDEEEGSEEETGDETGDGKEDSEGETGDETGDEEEDSEEETGDGEQAPGDEDKDQKENSENEAGNARTAGSSDSADSGWQKLVEEGSTQGAKYYVLTFTYVSNLEEAEVLYQVDYAEKIKVKEGAAWPTDAYSIQSASDEETDGGMVRMPVDVMAEEPSDYVFKYVGAGQGEYKLTMESESSETATIYDVELQNAPVYIRCCSGNDWLLRYVFHALNKQDNADKDFTIKVQAVTTEEVTYEMVQNADLVYLEDGAGTYLNAGITKSYIGTNLEDIDHMVIMTILYYAVTEQMPVIVDYGIIKDSVNYLDSDYQKLAKAFLKKDLQAFYYAMDESDNLVENVLMNAEDSKDYPNKKDNNYNYVNRNVYIVNDSNPLVSEDFPTSFDKDKAKAGFKEVLAAIKGENATLSEDDKMAEEVSKATAVQYIINYSVGMIGEFKDLSILELQPTANAVSDLHRSTDDGKDSVVLYWQREDRNEPGQQILRSSKKIETTVSVKSVVEFNGEYEDINSTYDMIFIGLDGQKLNQKGDKNPETVYNDSDLNGKVYHSGDKVAGSDAGYDANDITDGKKEKLLDYMRAGYPVVVEDACFKHKTAKDAESKDINTDYIGSDTQMYEFLKTAISEYEDYIYTISDVHSSALFIVQLNTMRPRIEWTKDTAESRVIETQLTENQTYRGSIEYRISNDRKPEEGGYAGELVKHVYLDMNYDGVFTREEEISEYGEEASENGSVISVDFKGISFGAVPWKVEIADAGNEYRRDAIQGYFWIAGEGEVPLRVLQVLDDTSKETANLQKIYQEVTNSTLGYYLKGAEELLHTDWEIETVTPVVLSERLATNASYLKNWDVLVLGFGESGNPGESVVSAVNSYISEGGSVVVSSAGAEEESGRLGLSAGYLGQMDQQTYGRLGRDSGSYYRYSGLNSSMFAKKSSLYAENINNGCITVYPYQIDSRFAFGVATELKAPDYLLNTGCISDENEVRATAWYTLNETGASINAYNVSPKDARNNYYVYSKGNVVYIGQSDYPYTYDAENHKVPEGNGTKECSLFVNAILAAYQGGIHPSKVSIVAGFPSTSAEVESIAIPFDQELKAAGDEDGGILDETVDVYFKFADNNLAFDKTMQVSFYYEDEAGESLALPQKTVNAIAFSSTLETVEENRLITVSGSELKQGQVYRIKAPVAALQNSDRSSAEIYIVLTSEFHKSGRLMQVMSADSVSLNRAQMFLLE